MLSETQIKEIHKLYLSTLAVALNDPPIRKSNLGKHAVSAEAIATAATKYGITKYNSQLLFAAMSRASHETQRHIKITTDNITEIRTALTTFQSALLNDIFEGHTKDVRTEPWPLILKNIKQLDSAIELPDFKEKYGDIIAASVGIGLGIGVAAVAGYLLWAALGGGNNGGPTPPAPSSGPSL